MGGAWRYSFEVARGLVNRGHVVHLITCKPEDGLSDLEVIDGVSFYRIKSKARQNIFSLFREIRKKVKTIAKHSRIDLIHVHNPLVGFLVDLIPILWGVPRVYHFHSLWSDEEKFNLKGSSISLSQKFRLLIIQLIEWHSFFWSQAVLFLSNYSKQRFKRFYPFGKKKSFIVGGGVDTKRFFSLNGNQTKASLRKECNLSVQPFTFLTVRRLETRMGLENLIHAVFSLSKRVPEKSFQVLIVGAGSLKDSLLSLIKDLGLQNQVKLCGKIPEPQLPKYYQAADIFILPTLAIEGFGLATAEALSSGLPALGTPVGATPEILEPINPRLILKGTSPEDLETGLEAVLKNPEQFLSLSQKCRTIAVKSYGWDTVVDKIESEFKRILAK